MSPRFTTPLPLRLISLLLAIAGFVFSTALFAQQTPPKKELSEKVSEALGQINALTTATPPNNDAALAKIDEMLKVVAPNSWDLTLLSQVKAQVLIGKGDLRGAIQPLEASLKLSDSYGFFDDKAENEISFILAQLYAGEADAAKVPDAKKAASVRAYSYVRRWLDNAPRTDAKIEDAQLFAATILYNQAQINATEIDMSLMKRSVEEAEKGLLLRAKPKDQFYTIILAGLQQMGQYEKSAEILEMLVRTQPKNKTYWQQLAATYVQLNKDVRAIVTFERAQKEEILTTPKDNYNLAGLYYNIQQYDYVAEIVGNGLQTGAIEPLQTNYELLASAYQQSRKELKAVEALKEAARKFPKAASIDVLISQIFYGLDKFEDAYRFMDSAVKKESKNPAQAYSFLAYLALELKKFDEAKVAADKAVQLDPKSREAIRLRDAIDESIKEREAYKTSSNR